MTPEQATGLAKRIINTMRPTPAIGEWAEVLEPLDLDAALKTFHDLRAVTDHGLAIATFLRSYDQRTSPDRPTRRGQPDPHCTRCSGDGWVDGEPIVETVDGEPHPYTTLAPCPCTGAPDPTPRSDQLTF